MPAAGRRAIDVVIGFGATLSLAVLDFSFLLLETTKTTHHYSPSGCKIQVVDKDNSLVNKLYSEDDRSAASSGSATFIIVFGAGDSRGLARAELAIFARLRGSAARYEP